MDLEKLEQVVQRLVDDIDEANFIYGLLLAYGLPKATVTRLKNGDRNQSKKPGEIIWKKNLCFTGQPEGDLFTCIDTLKSDPTVKKHHPRFIVVTDYETFLAIDTKTDDSLDVPIGELPKRANFFLPWAGMEKSGITSENPADIKAAEKMGQLYDLLLHNNEVESEKSRHALNVFLSRLLFCFFAEDTGIFDDDQFTKLVDSHTVEDGGNLQALLERLFKALNAKDRSDYPEYIRAFPYVNGGLFADDLPVPAFSRKSRKMLIDCGALNWKAINPDIFGSMMQAVTLGEERSSIGMHYTSMVNIMKVIEPLFLNDLQEQLEKASDNEKKLEKLLDRLYHILIFDPACGSGNFLIIAYKELCRLEIEIFQQLQELNPSKWSIARPGIQLNRFFGIEIDDFAAETARLSLWLAEHQMNQRFESVFGATKPTLPLTHSGNIICGNAARSDWSTICPRSESEVYVLGNPPYLGSSMQSHDQKEDMALVFKGVCNYKMQDYISLWFYKAAKYVRNEGRFAFVTTNSIFQGAQVETIWPMVLDNNLEINFAEKDFLWSNNAKGNAGVTCSVVAFRPVSNQPKFIKIGAHRSLANNINAYLIDGPNIIIAKRTTSLSSLPKMVLGNTPRDGGNLILSSSERSELVDSHPESERFIRRYCGSADFIRGTERWCLWISDVDLREAEDIEPIRARIDRVRKFRLSAGKNARQKANVSHKFEFALEATSSQILVPRHSSIRREYIPFGYLDPSIIVADSAQAIYDPAPYVFAIISSRLHMVWVGLTSGRLKTDYRYSTYFTYNTFPIPSLDERRKEQLERCAFHLIDEREKYTELSIGSMYDPDKMPMSLKKAHLDVDACVEECYQSRHMSDDEERIRVLLRLYEDMASQRHRDEQV